MSGPVFTYGELVVLALVVPFAPFVAWVLSDAWDAVVGWFLDAPELEDEVSR